MLGPVRSGSARLDFGPVGRSKCIESALNQATRTTDKQTDAHSLAKQLLRLHGERNANCSTQPCGAA